MGQTLKKLSIGGIDIPIGGGGEINPIATTAINVEYTDGTSEDFYVLDESNGSASGGVDLDTYNAKVAELESKDATLSNEINNLKSSGGGDYKIFDPDSEITSIENLSYGTYLVSFTSGYSSCEIETPYFANEGGYRNITLFSGDEFSYTRQLGEGIEILKCGDRNIVWHTDGAGDIILDSDTTTKIETGLKNIDLSNYYDYPTSEILAYCFGEGGMYAIGGEVEHESFPNGSKIFVNSFVYMDTKWVYYTVIKPNGTIDAYYGSCYYEDDISSSDISGGGSAAQNTLEILNQSTVNLIYLKEGTYMVLTGYHNSVCTLTAEGSISGSFGLDVKLGAIINVDTYTIESDYQSKYITINYGSHIHTVNIVFDGAGDTTVTFEQFTI